MHESWKRRDTRCRECRGCLLAQVCLFHPPRDRRCCSQVGKKTNESLNGEMSDFGFVVHGADEFCEGGLGFSSHRQQGSGRVSPYHQVGIRESFGERTNCGGRFRPDFPQCVGCCPPEFCVPIPKRASQKRSSRCGTGADPSESEGGLAPHPRVRVTQRLAQGVHVRAGGGTYHAKGARCFSPYILVGIGDCACQLWGGRRGFGTDTGQSPGRAFPQARGRTGERQGESLHGFSRLRTDSGKRFRGSHGHSPLSVIQRAGKCSYSRRGRGPQLQQSFGGRPAHLEIGIPECSR